MEPSGGQGGGGGLNTAVACPTSVGHVARCAPHKVPSIGRLVGREATHLHRATGGRPRVLRLFGLGGAGWRSRCRIAASWSASICHGYAIVVQASSEAARMTQDEFAEALRRLVGYYEDEGGLETVRRYWP